MKQGDNSRPPVGSAIGAVAGIIIIIAFFLPWVQACGTEMSGYDLATNSTGLVEESWQYWIVPASGVFLAVLFLLIRTSSFGGRIGMGVVRLVIGLIGFLPVLNIWRNVQQKGGAMEILYGGWVLAAGFAIVFLSFVVDLLPLGDD